MSFDINREIKKGEQAAKAQERAKRRGAALGRGSSAGKRSGSSARASGRAAIRTARQRGKGIAIKSIKNSRGFKGIDNYANDPKKNPELIYENGDVRSMIACSKLRPDIKNPVGHQVFSLPPSSGRLDKKDWEAIIATARKALNLDDSFSAKFVVHNETDHQHGHLYFCRVNVRGEVHDQANIGLRCAALERIIEDKHGLKLVPPSEFKNHNNRATKNEIEMGLRTGKLPPRLQIAAALKIAIQGKPTTQQFCERLQAAGIGIKANVSPSTGKMNGFSFIFDGVPFSGSKISKEYGWKNLSENIDHEQTRDASFLDQLDGSTGDAGRNLADTVATIDALDSAVARVHPAAADDRTNHRNDQTIAERTSVLDGQTKSASAQQAKPATKATIRGFTRTDILDSSKRGWIDSLHCRIGTSRVSAIKKQRADRLALLDQRDRISAISTATGYAIPDPKTLSDEQIISLLQDMGGDQIEIRGTPDFCERVEAVANQNGLKVSHEFQVTEAERKAAIARMEARAREELLQKNANSNSPSYRPGGI